MPDLCVMLAAVQPVRGRRGELLLEEGRLVDAVGPALAGGGPAGDVRHHGLGDVDVVVEHLCLCGTRRRVQHLVRVGQLHPAVSIHHLTVLPAVPLDYDENVHGVPARGGSRPRRSTRTQQPIRPTSSLTARAIRPRWTTTAGRCRTRSSHTTHRAPTRMCRSASPRAKSRWSGEAVRSRRRFARPQMVRSAPRRRPSSQRSQWG